MTSGEKLILRIPCDLYEHHTFDGGELEIRTSLEGRLGAIIIGLLTGNTACPKTPIPRSFQKSLTRLTGGLLSNGQRQRPCECNPPA